MTEKEEFLRCLMALKAAMDSVAVAIVDLIKSVEKDSVKPDGEDRSVGTSVSSTQVATAPIVKRRGYSARAQVTSGMLEQVRAEYENGDHVLDIAKRHRVSDGAIYLWAEKYHWDKSKRTHKRRRYSPQAIANMSARKEIAPVDEKKFTDQIRESVKVPTLNGVGQGQYPILAAEQQAMDTLRKALCQVKQVGEGQWEVDGQKLNRVQFVTMGLNIRTGSG